MQYLNCNDLPSGLPAGVEILFDDTGKTKEFTNIFTGIPRKESLYNARTRGLSAFGLTEFQINNVAHFEGEQTLGVVAHTVVKHAIQPHANDVLSLGYVPHTCVKENDSLMRLAWRGD